MHKKESKECKEPVKEIQKCQTTMPSGVIAKWPISFPRNGPAREKVRNQSEQLQHSKVITIQI